MAVDSPSLAPVHIGTSGWHYKHWKGPFYPAGLASTKWLPWYVDHFDTVEVNNSVLKTAFLSEATAPLGSQPIVTTNTARNNQMADHCQGEAVQAGTGQ